MARNTGGITVKRFVCMLFALAMVFGMCTAFGAMAEGEKTDVLYNGKHYAEITLEEAIEKGYVMEVTSFEDGFFGKAGIGIDAIVYPCGKIVVPGEEAEADTDCKEYAVLFSRNGVFYFMRLAEDGYESGEDTAAFFANSGIETVVADGKAEMAAEPGEIVYNGETYHECMPVLREEDEPYIFVRTFRFEGGPYISLWPLDNGFLVYDPNDYDPNDHDPNDHDPNDPSCPDDEIVYFYFGGVTSFTVGDDVRDGEVKCVILPDGETLEAEKATVDGKKITVVYIPDLQNFDGEDIYVLFTSHDLKCYMRCMIMIL